MQSANEATYTFSLSYELRFDGSSLTEVRISIMGATGRVVAEVFAERTELAANDTWEQRKKYVHDDHLGSPSVVTDRAGAVESNVIYGPWGQARDGENWILLRWWGRLLRPQEEAWPRCAGSSTILEIFAKSVESIGVLVAVRTGEVSITGSLPKRTEPFLKGFGMLDSTC